MKSLSLFAIAAFASIALISCSKEVGITVTNSEGQIISAFSPGYQGATSSDWTVKTEDGSDWSVTTSGIPGMSASPTSGKTNYSFNVTVPENTGAARVGYVYVYATGGKTPTTITVNQSGK